MSRIGKKPILIPEDVKVKIEGQKVIVKGPKGELQKEVSPEIRIELKENKIFLTILNETKKNKSLWGLTRNVLANAIKGVSDGFEKKLEIEGIGYKALMSGNGLEFSVGFSHPVKLEAPEGIKFSVEKNTIIVSGIDKELVGQIAAKIRKIKPPEPYKGKGIRYAGEIIKKKIGKKAVAAGG